MQHQDHQRNTTITIILETGMIVCWSSGFIGGLLASETGSIFAVLFWRFLIASGLLAPWSFTSVMKLPPKALLVEVVVGALAMFGYTSCMIAAINLGLSPGIGALIAALQPLVTASLSAAFLKDTIFARQWIGLIIGLSGVGIAVKGDIDTAPVLAYVLAAVSMACLTCATLISKRQPNPLSVVPTVGLQCFISAGLFLPLALLEESSLFRIDLKFVQPIAWFILLSTFGAYGLYWACLKRTTATRVSSLIYLTPATTALWAWAMFDTPISVDAAFGGTICLAGITLGSGKSWRSLSLQGGRSRS